MISSLRLFILAVVLMQPLGWEAAARPQLDALVIKGLTNFQVNDELMISAGLPDQTQFETFASAGVKHVIDLIPGDRSEEHALVESLGMTYYNIPVDWENPTLDNFDRYRQIVNQARSKGEVVLTHCKLNWRGSSFTYLYRTVQLEHDSATASDDLQANWQPNATWEAFIQAVRVNRAKIDAGTDSVKR